MKAIKQPLTIELEDCGRWFDEYVVLDGNKDLLCVRASPDKVPPRIRRALAESIRVRNKFTPVEGKFMMEFLEYNRHEKRK